METKTERNAFQSSIHPAQIYDSYSLFLGDLTNNQYPENRQQAPSTQYSLQDDKTEWPRLEANKKTPDITCQNPSSAASGTSHAKSSHTPTTALSPYSTRARARRTQLPGPQQNTATCARPYYDMRGRAPSRPARSA